MSPYTLGQHAQLMINDRYIAKVDNGNNQRNIKFLYLIAKETAYNQSYYFNELVMDTNFSSNDIPTRRL